MAPALDPKAGTHRNMFFGFGEIGFLCIFEFFRGVPGAQEASKRLPGGRGSVVLI